jgi:hypothetical protein
VVPFVVIVGQVFLEGVPEHGFPDYNHPFKAFFLNRPHPSFGVGVQVWALVGEHEGSDAFIPKDATKSGAKLAAPVMKDYLALLQPI